MTTHPNRLQWQTFLFTVVLVMPQLANAYTQSGPSTVCSTADLALMSIDIVDAPLCTFVGGTTRYWLHSENYGNTFQKFAGTLASPCGTLLWEKTEAQLFTNIGSIDGEPWIVNTYKDTNGLLAFIHIERAGTNRLKGRIGLAWSTDNGDTFTYLGNILSPYGDQDMASGGFMQGVPYLVKDGYFYVYYTDNNGYYDDGGGIATARALVSDVITAAMNGTTCDWYKYKNGAWTSVGLGGDFTNIANAKGISHCGAAYSTYDGKCYLTTTTMAFAGSTNTTYIKLWQSTDCVNWTLYTTVAEQVGLDVAPNSGYQYVKFVDGSGDANGVIGQTFYVYSGLHPTLTDEKVLQRWSIDLAGGSPTIPTPPDPTTPNLAFNGTYSSSSNYDTSQTADKAFDGNTSTDWQAAAGGGFNGQWLQVDLGTDTTFNTAVIREYGARATGYRIDYWNGSSWQTAYTGTTTTVGTNDPSKTIIFPAVKGSKARLYFLDGTAQPIIYEFGLYYTTTSPDWAIVKWYESSSNYNRDQNAAKAFDGTLATNWQGASGAGFANQWVGVTSTGNMTFNKAVITEYGNRTSGFRIEYWNGTSWQTAYTGTSIGDYWNPLTVTFPSVTGNKARLYFTSGTATPIIYEFSLYNDPGTANVALLDENYTCSSSLNTNTKAAKAFDKSLGSAWQPASGQAFAGQWVQVDFKTNRTFNAAVLNEYGNRTTGYRIEYWNGSAWNTAYTGTTIGANSEFKSVNFPEVTGSMARLYFTSGSQLPIIYAMELYERTSSANFGPPELPSRAFTSSSDYNASQTADKAFDGDPASNWQAAAGSGFSGQWLEVDFGVGTVFNSVLISEYGNRTAGYRIEYWDGSSWHTAYTGTTIGSALTVSFSPVTGSKARIYFTAGTSQPAIYTFEVHDEP